MSNQMEQRRIADDAQWQAAEDRVAELEAALQPFGDYAREQDSHYEPPLSDSARICNSGNGKVRLRIEDFRRAGKATEKKPLTTIAQAIAEQGTDLERTFLFHFQLAQRQGIEFPEMVREFYFDHTRGYRADFAFPSVRILVECEGMDHQKPATYHKDVDKYNLAGALGWIVLRCTTRSLAHKPDQFISLLVLAIKTRQAEMQGKE